MLAPCRCCPRYTLCWLFTAPLLGDRLMFILVIWQRHSGTDESGAGRSCFATFPLPHHRGFPETAFPYAVLAASFVGPWSLGWGSDPWAGGAIPGMRERSLGWGNDPWDGGAIPGIGRAIPGTDPWCWRQRSAKQQAQGGAGQVFWVLPAIRSIANLLGHVRPLLPQFPKL